MYDLDKLCADSKLDLCAGEKAAMRKALNEMLGRLCVLDSLAPFQGDSSGCASLRDLRRDRVLESFSASEALSNATASKDGLFAAPKA